MSSGLAIWTVYRHPDDFPDWYVARKFDNDRPTEVVLIGRSLQDVRSQLPRGLVYQPRHPNDEPQIVETWF